MSTKQALLLLTIFITSILFYQSCVEPIDAEYDLQTDILFIDAYALTEPGLSTVTVSKSVFEFNTYKIINVPNAIVKIENVNTGESINFTQDLAGIYQCPPDFAAAVGETWKLFIDLEEGKKIESKPQTIRSSVPIENIQVDYAPDIEFNPTFDRFIPGHRVSIDWQDPEDEENYYLWKYRTFEPLIVCKTCPKGEYFRNGSCISNGSTFGPPYLNYLCDPACWQIKYGAELPIFEDLLENGANIVGRSITVLPFYRRPSISIEIQQFSLDKSAYEYFKVINSQVSESGGLNAPPPAPLLGNLINPDDESDLILGQFTAAGVSTKSVYIERSLIAEDPIRPDNEIILETCATCPQQFPCEESTFRTSIKPEGWP